MTREKLAEIFNETQEKYVAEHLNQEKITELLSQYADENGKISNGDMLSFAYIEGFKNSVDFVWEILKNLVEYEEQQGKASEEA